MGTIAEFVGLIHEIGAKEKENRGLRSQLKDLRELTGDLARENTELRGQLRGLRSKVDILLARIKDELTN